MSDAFDPLRLLLETLRAIPREELVAALRAHHERSAERAGTGSERLVGLLEEAKARLRAGLPLDRPHDPSERLRAQLLDHDRFVRRHAERVDRVLARTLAEEPGSSTPPAQRLLRLSGPPGQPLLTRFRLKSALPVAAAVGLRAGGFTADGRTVPAPTTRFEPAGPRLEPGESCVLTLEIDPAKCGLLPGQLLEGHAIVTLGGDEVLRLGLELQLGANREGGA